MWFVDDRELLYRLTGCIRSATRVRGDCFGGPLYRMTWALSGTTLRFTDYVGDDNWANDQYLIEPWEKIG